MTEGALTQLLAWMLHPRVVLTLSLLSLAAVVASALALPWLIRRLPEDWLVVGLADSGDDGAATTPTSWRQRLRRLLRNVVGWLLVAAGVAMLVLPGQGLLTIFAGLILVDFQGKRRVLRWCLARPGVLPVLDRLRVAGGRSPLRRPPAGHA